MKNEVNTRMVSDLRQLNLVYEKDNYPLLNLEDSMFNLLACNVFSKLGLFYAYYKHPLAEESKKYSTLNVPFGSSI